MELALSVRGLVKVFRSGERGNLTTMPALRDVAFDISRGEMVGSVGGRGGVESILVLCPGGLRRGEGGRIGGFGEEKKNPPPTPVMTNVQTEHLPSTRCNRL